MITDFQARVLNCVDGVSTASMVHKKVKGNLVSVIRSLEIFASNGFLKRQEKQEVYSTRKVVVYSLTERGRLLKKALNYKPVSGKAVEK